MKVLCCNWHCSKRVSFWSQRLVEISLIPTADSRSLKQQATRVIFKAPCYFWLLQKFFTCVFSEQSGRFRLTWQTLGRVSCTSTSSSPHAIWRITMTGAGWFPFTSCGHDKPALAARNRNNLLDSRKALFAKSSCYTGVEESRASDTPQFVLCLQGTEAFFARLLTIFR